MNDKQTKAVEKLRQQQSKHAEGSAPWAVAAQLIDICFREPRAAEIILPDLDNPEMDVVHAEKQINALADEKHKAHGGKCVCVTPTEAEAVLRKFYGLPVYGQMPVVGLPDADALPGTYLDPAPVPANDSPLKLNLLDYL